MVIIHHAILQSNVMEDEEFEMKMWMAGAIAAAAIALEAEEEENMSLVDHRKLPCVKQTLWRSILP